MKKIIALVLVVCMAVLCFASCGNKGKDEAQKTAAFVTFSVNGDFFTALANTFESAFKADGWKTYVTDGAFNPATQVTACENYIAMHVDVLFIWAVSAEAVANIVNQAREAGIKVIAFVQELAAQDVLMVSDNTKLAEDTCKLAAEWLEANYASATTANPVEVAVFTERSAETGVVQANALLRLDEFTSVPVSVVEVACSAESEEEGQQKMENYYTTHPNTKLFLTAHNALAKGINSFFTSESSPVTNYTGYGIYAINGDDATANLIASTSSPFRGMTLTGSVADTVGEMLMCANGILDGSIQVGHVQQAATVFVDEAHANEYITTGKSTKTIAD